MNKCWKGEKGKFRIKPQIIYSVYFAYKKESKKIIYGK